MTRDETKKIVRIMVASYTSFRPTTEELKDMTDAWNMMLSEYSYDDVAIALKTYITVDNSGFPPTIGQIIDKIHTIRSPDTLSDAEAWSLVWDAIQNSGYDSKAEFDKLPAPVKRAVGSADVLKSWAIDEYFSYEKARTNFLFSYKKEANRADEIEKLPSDVKKLIESVKIGIKERIDAKGE